MYPKIGPIMTYGLFYLAGIVLHFLIGWRLARRRGLRRRVWILAGLCYLLGMVVGAKALFDLREGNFQAVALLQARHYAAGGLWGGLLAYFAPAVPLVLVVAHRKWDALDLTAETVPLPWIAAKVGCFLNGCCHGRPCSLPWAVTFPEAARTAPAGTPIHPTQLYEVGIMLILLGVFATLRSNRWRGTKLLWFLAIYGLGRAATDFLRGDACTSARLGPLSLTQTICLATATVAGLALLAAFRRMRVAHMPAVPGP